MLNKQKLPVLLKYAETDAFDISGAHDGGGLRPPLPNGAAAEVIMCSASVKSIGLRISQKHSAPIPLKALAIHIL